MAGAGVVSTSSGVPVILLRSSPAWNGRCWNDRFSGQTAERYRLRSSPAWNGRCWLARALDWITRKGVAILTGLEWPVLDLAVAGEKAVGAVAILTGLEWPVLAITCKFGYSGALVLRSSPTWNGRCWAPAARVAVWTQDGLRSSPTWNGRCWRDGVAPGVRLGEEVAILTDLEWPVLVCVHTCGVSPPI